MRLIDADELKSWLNGFVETDNISPTYMRSLIDTQPTVEAFPVEWILNKYREKWEKAEMGRRDFQFCEVIDELLEDWEKENEID